MDSPFAQVTDVTDPMLDDGELIDRFQRQPDMAGQTFVTLYRRYVRPVYAYLYARVGNRMDAEDLTEQAFLEALERLAEYHHQGQFSAWLFTIARRRAVDYYRRLRHDSSLELIGQLADCGDDLSEQIDRRAKQAALASLVHDLDEDERELLRLRFAGGLSFAAIAEIFKRKESAVKMSYYRLLRRLEDQMEVKHG